MDYHPKGGCINIVVGAVGCGRPKGHVNKKLRDFMVDLAQLKKAMLSHFMDTVFQDLQFPPEE
eukprot:9798844-Alexandrium_andersonii.AAC.1